MTTSRIQELYDIIAAANEELTQLRKVCQHPNYRVAMYMWRIGSIHPQRICDDCGDIVEGITDKESNACWDEWHAQSKAAVEEMELG